MREIRRALRNEPQLSQRCGRQYISGLSKFGSKKKPKQWTSSQRKKTVAQQKAERQASRGKTVFQELFERTGIRPRAKTASRYTVKERQIKYETTTEPAFEPKKVYVPGHLDNKYRWIDGKMVEQMQQVERTVRKPVGEILSLKRLNKKSGGPGGTKGGRADKGISHRTGTMKARKMGARKAKLGGTRGGKPQREKKKQPQVIGKKKS